MGKACVGYACSDDTNILREKRRLDLSHLLRFYTEFPTKSKFFLLTDFFDKLAGTRRLKQQVLEGKSETEI